MPIRSLTKRNWLSRTRTVRRVREILSRPDARALDICCGTAGLLLAMLFESGALHLPVRDASLDLITVAFVFRNLTNYEAGLVEIRRVLRPGGMAAIREFSQPPNHVFRAVRVLPAAHPADDRRHPHAMLTSTCPNHSQGLR